MEDSPGVGVRNPGVGAQSLQWRALSSGVGRKHDKGPNQAGQDRAEEDNLGEGSLGEGSRPSLQGK